MSIDRYVARPGSVALTAAATKSLLLINPAADGGRLTEVGISLDAAAAVAGVGFELYRVVTIGSPAGTTGTLVKAHPSAAAAGSTFLHTLTTEPTTVEILRDWFLQPFGGLIVAQFPLGRELDTLPAGARIGLRYVTPAAVTPNCRAYIEFEEG